LVSLEPPIDYNFSGGQPHKK